MSYSKKTHFTKIKLKIKKTIYFFDNFFKNFEKRGFLDEIFCKKRLTTFYEFKKSFPKKIKNCHFVSTFAFWQ